MPVRRALDLIERASEEDAKEYAFRIYLEQYHYMTKETFRSFKDFWEEVKPKKAEMDTRDKDTLINDILTIGR